jgi:hypothetical protein
VPFLFCLFVLGCTSFSSDTVQPSRLFAIGRGTCIALLALKLFSDSRSTTFRRKDPRAIYPRRIVARVLKVAAIEFGDPVIFGVQVETGDAAFHRYLTVFREGPHFPRAADGPWIVGIRIGGKT